MKKKKIGFVESMMQHHRIIYLVIVLLIGYGIYGLIGMNKQEFPEFYHTLNRMVSDQES